MHMCFSEVDGLFEPLEQLIPDFLCGFLQKRLSHLVGSGGIRGLPSNVGFQVMADLAFYVGIHKMFLAALQKWQDNGIRSSAKGLESLNHCYRRPH